MCMWNIRGNYPLLTARGRYAASLASMVILCSAAPARSKPKPAEAPAAAKAEDKVSTRLREADKAYVDGDFAKALEVFRQVDAIDPSFKTRLKIADCLDELGQLSEAFEALDALVNGKGPPPDQKDKERAEQALAKLRSTTSVLSIKVSEQDARLVVDGVEYGRGPIERSLRRKPGHATISVTKSGFEPWAKEIDLAAGEEQQVTADLAPEKALGSLVVQMTGKGPAHLILDGKDVGPLPWTGEVPAGSHQISARGDHGISAMRTIAVSSKGRTELELTLVENPAKIRVTATDARAVIRIDGTPYGSGQAESDVLPGKHVVSVEQPGYVPSVFNLELEAGELKALDHVVLERAAPPPAQHTEKGMQGIYTMVALDGLIGKATSEIAANCPATSVGGSCSSGPNFASAVDLHVGYSFGTFGAEGFLLGGTNFTLARMEFPRDVNSNESAWYGLARKERYLLFEPMFGGGAAGRVSTQGKAVRLSTALGLGLLYRATELHRKAETTGSSTQSSVVRRDNVSHWTGGGGKVVPMFIWDSELELGDTPGTRAFLGIHAQVEFGAEPPVTPDNVNLGFDASSGSAVPLGSGSLEIRRSPAFFIGPRFGVVTGH